MFHQPIPPLRKSDVLRIAAKIARRTKDECWPWLGSRSGKGYGNIVIAGVVLTVTRVIWNGLHGDPGDRQICHTCDNPPCCNPGHWFLGTQTDNTMDSVHKGRANRASGVRHGTATHPETRPRGEGVRHLAKLTAANVREIRELHASGLAISRLSERFSVTYQNVRAIVLRKTWKHVNQN